MADAHPPAPLHPAGMMLSLLHPVEVAQEALHPAYPGTLLHAQRRFGSIPTPLPAPALDSQAPLLHECLVPSAGGCPPGSNWGQEEGQSPAVAHS